MNRLPGAGSKDAQILKKARPGKGATYRKIWRALLRVGIVSSIKPCVHGSVSGGPSSKASITCERLRTKSLRKRSPNSKHKY